MGEQGSICKEAWRCDDDVQFPPAAHDELRSAPCNQQAWGWHSGTLGVGCPLRVGPRQAWLQTWIAVTRDAVSVGHIRCSVSGGRASRGDPYSAHVFAQECMPSPREVFCTFSCSHGDATQHAWSQK